MATLYDNAFTSDTIDVRLARLQAIQDNHATTLPLLPNLKADIAAWMQQCYSSYSGKRTNAGVNENSKKSGTQDKDAALLQLREQLFLAREHVEANFNATPTRREDYGLKGNISQNANALQELADKVLEVHAIHKAENLSDVMCDAHIQDIRDAKVALHNALQVTTDRKSGKDGAHDDSQAMFDQDTVMLDRLLAAWHQALKYADARITLIGMANVRRGGNPGRPGVPTLLIDPHDRSLVITPNNKRPAPTSYQTQIRESGENNEWENFATGSDNRIATAERLVNGSTEYEFRTRAHNANGYGEWSQVIRRVG